MFRKIAARLAKTKYVREALEDTTDLKSLRLQRSPRMTVGLILICFSYIIGWPAVGAFGVLAVYFREPLVVAIGGPVIYGISHLVFLAGAWLAGAEHARFLMRYTTKVVFRKILRHGTETPTTPGVHPTSGKPH
jgi:hypothetical protein